MKTNTSHKIRVPFIEQAQQTECGFCCIAMIVSYYKSSVSFHEMYERIGNGRDGTSLFHLRNLATDVGLEANCYKVEDSSELSQYQLPCVLYWKGRHFVVLEKITKKGFYIVDPAAGPLRLNREQFDQYFTHYVMTCTPSENFKIQKKKNIWKPYFDIVLKRPKLLVIIALLSIALQLITLAMPILIQFLIDDVIKPQNLSFLYTFLWGIIIFVGLQFSFNLLRGKIIITLENFLDKRMMSNFMKHLLHLPYHFFLLRKFGDLLLRVNSLRVIRDMIGTNLIKGILDISLVLVILFYMSYKSLLMTVCVLAFTLINVLLIVLTRSKIRESSQSEIMANTELQSIQTETLYGISTVKTSGIENKIYSNWTKNFGDLLLAYKRKENVKNYVNSLSSSISMMAPLVVLWLGTYLIFQGQLTLGGLIAFHAITNQFFGLSQSLIQVTQSFFVASTYLSRVHDVLDAEKENTGENLLQPEKLKGNIRLENVSFSYTKFSTEAIKDVSLQVHSNQKVAIIGKSGAGKSTLARLILGLHLPSEGNIYFDNINLKDLDSSYLRRLIGVVPQEVTLFNKTIFENIAIYDKEISLEQVIEAAKIAQIHNDIMKMPMQYNTFVSEMGYNISGGQRQRIALARALVHKPSLLVLDEATSSLDHVTEKLVDDYLNQINCTRVVVAHRLTTIMNADRIIVMDKGKIIETGTHLELLKNDGYYSSFFNDIRHEDFSENGTKLVVNS